MRRWGGAALLALAACASVLGFEGHRYRHAADLACPTPAGQRQSDGRAPSDGQRRCGCERRGCERRGRTELRPDRLRFHERASLSRCGVLRPTDLDARRAPALRLPRGCRTQHRASSSSPRVRPWLYGSSDADTNIPGWATIADTNDRGSGDQSIALERRPFAFTSPALPLPSDVVAIYVSSRVRPRRGIRHTTPAPDREHPSANHTLHRRGRSHALRRAQWHDRRHPLARWHGRGAPSDQPGRNPVVSADDSVLYLERAQRSVSRTPRSTTARLARRRPLHCPISATTRANTSPAGSPQTTAASIITASRTPPSGWRHGSPSRRRSTLRVLAAVLGVLVLERFEALARDLDFEDAVFLDHGLAAEA